MMKELYLSPIAELNKFDVKDIITTSPPNDGEPVVANETEPNKTWSDPR